MNPKIRTPYNAAQMPKAGLITTQPSLSIPDQSMSLTEILERYAKGLSFEGAGPAVYDEDDGGYIPDFRRMDLTEQFEYMEKTSADLQKKIEDGKIAKAKSLSDKEFERRLEEWKKTQGADSGIAKTVDS